MLRSIVTQPPQDNYVYARGFDTLDRVRNLVLNKACRVLVTPTTLRPPITRSMPTTTFTDFNRGEDPTNRPIPSFNGRNLVNFYIEPPHFIAIVLS